MEQKLISTISFRVFVFGDIEPSREFRNGIEGLLPHSRGSRSSTVYYTVGSPQGSKKA